MERVFDGVSDFCSFEREDVLSCLGNTVRKGNKLMILVEIKAEGSKETEELKEVGLDGLLK